MWANLTAPITFTGAGTVVAVAAPSDYRRIAVVSFHVQVDAVCTLQFKDGTSALTGVVPQVAGGGWIYNPLYGGPMNANYWWVGSVNTALNLVVVGSANGGGLIQYRLIGESR